MTYLVMTVKQQLQAWFFIVLAVLSTSWTQAAETKKLVLVANTNTELKSLSPRNIRLMFLGVPIKGMIKGENIPLLPLRNTTDTLLYQVFLQKIIHMSAQKYKQRVLTLVLQGAGQPPINFKNTSNLVDRLTTDNNTITYMWASTVKNFPNIKVVQELWQGQVH